MSRFIPALFILAFFASTDLSAQKDTTFTTKFIPHEVTYNASPNPKECWEAVAWGIEIKVGKGFQFFSMPAIYLDSLKKKIGDSEVQVEVYYFKEMDRDRETVGAVKQITLNNVVIYKEE